MKRKKMTNMNSRRSFGRHALVIGGSIAGLTAGRVLADYFEKVTIIERDAWNEGPNSRKGVPQARHPHVLLKRGELILEELFPGLGRELVAPGATQSNMGRKR